MFATQLTWTKNLKIATVTQIPLEFQFISVHEEWKRRQGIMRCLKTFEAHGIIRCLMNCHPLFSLEDENENMGENYLLLMNAQTVGRRTEAHDLVEQS